jgi:uncharacterized membrane protein
MPRTETTTKPRDQEGLRRAGALAGAATLLGLAARRRTAGAWTGAAFLALPLAVRGVSGHWPLEESLRDPAIDVRATLTIERPPREVFDAWRDLEKLPEILRHLKTVEETGDGRSRWVARTPFGDVEWRAEVVEERPGELLRWRSLEGSEVEHEGSLEMRPWRSEGSTVLLLRLRAAHRRGAPTGPAADLLRPALAREIEEDLRRFKSRMEAGEVPTTEGQPAGHRSPLAPSNPF